MKKTILKVLTYLGALGIWGATGIGEIKLLGKIFERQLSDEYAEEHPRKAALTGLVCILILFLTGYPFYLGCMWCAEKISGKIDNMPDDYIEKKEDEEWNS